LSIINNILQMNIIFRTDSGFEIGSGHVMRCLTLADELCKKTDSVSFICKEIDGNMIDYIQDRGFNVHKIKESEKETIEILKKTRPEWLIIDHYDIDSKQEKSFSNFTTNIMIIDDLANRSHFCDILLDQNLYSNMDDRYNNLVPTSCNLLLGPKYALLRPEFRNIKEIVKTDKVDIKRILVFYGGSDHTGETIKALKALKDDSFNDIYIDVVIGSQNKNSDEIRDFCNLNKNFYFNQSISNMAYHMSKADLSLGAGGSTSWERCCLGIPAIVITTASNQVELAEYLDTQKIILYLGYHNSVDIYDIRRKLQSLLKDRNILSDMSKNCKMLTDGLGATKCTSLLQNYSYSREIVKEDMEKILEWRNSNHIRNNMIHSTVITVSEHKKWFTSTIKNNLSVYRIFYYKGNIIGLFNFINIDNSRKEAEWGFYIGEERFLKKGLGKKITKHAISYAFNELNLQTIVSKIVKNNEASITLHEKLGFYEININTNNNIELLEMRLNLND